MSESDLVMLLTGRGITCRTPEGQLLSVKGVAERKGICGTKKVIVVSDWDPDELYVSYSSAVHEIMHSLGSPHDGADTSESCSPDDRHIMAPVASEKRKTTFSSCTIDAVTKFLKQPEAHCLFVRGRINTSQWCSKTIQDSDLKNKREARCTSLKENGEYFYVQKPGTWCKFICLFVNITTDAATRQIWQTDDNGTACDMCNPTKKCFDGKCVETPSSHDDVIDN
ncbi:hypothetical protein MTO96_046875 [Rhipicephalus appendiculatus]